jgi:pSer/pThr/pTyr-binding forkhead associated (FHA) protein
MWILRSDDATGPDVLLFRVLPGGIKTIGRARVVDFVIDAPLVSRVHCRVTAAPGGHLELEDLGSTNGTYVNGSRVSGRTRLAAGDRLGVGRAVLVVEEEKMDRSEK